MLHFKFLSIKHMNFILELIKYPLLNEQKNFSQLQFFKTDQEGENISKEKV